VKKVDSSELEIGMYVAKLDRPWLESPFLFQGFTIKSQDEITQLRNLCKFVYIDEEKQPGSASAVRNKGRAATWVSSETKSGRKPHLRKVEDELVAARKIRQHAQLRFNQMLEAARLGKGIEVKVANNIVGDMIESLLRNPDALMLLRNIGQYDTEAESHAINTCILALTFGRCLGLSDNDLEELGLAAMLHDIGETEIPLDLLRDGPKSAEETELLNRHTEFGARLLRDTASLPERVIDVALSHHEQVNGEGYPQGLEGEKIGFFARIVAILNVYDHVTLGSSGPSMPPAEALRYLYLYRNKFFDADLTEKFIQCLGVYPVGSLVELATGEVAIVISIPPEAHLYPRLLLALDSHKQPYQPPRIMSLAQFATSEHAEKYAITSVLPSGAYGVDIKAYLQQQTGL
jgi:HD-GYP domain-containing protein (c-di-GMP phosphodiesterase class II)